MDKTLEELRAKYAELNKACPCCGGGIEYHSKGGIVEEIYFAGVKKGEEYQKMSNDIQNAKTF